MEFHTYQLGMVDAIDDGKIVRVSEEYARREGLPVIRRFSEEKKSAGRESTAKSAKGLLRFEEFRKPLKDKGLVSELANNFHWILQKKRKDRGMTRKQVAASLNITENELKMAECGVLPREDFVITSKLEEYYKINLRKQGQPASVSLAKELSEPADSSDSVQRKDAVEDKKGEKSKAISGDEIEIFD